MNAVCKGLQLLMLFGSTHRIHNNKKGNPEIGIEPKITKTGKGFVNWWKSYMDTVLQIEIVFILKFVSIVKSISTLKTKLPSKRFS